MPRRFVASADRLVARNEDGASWRPDQSDTEKHALSTDLPQSYVGQFGDVGEARDDLADGLAPRVGATLRLPRKGLAIEGVRKPPSL